jgi:type IV secretory pathway VirB4 component
MMRGRRRGLKVETSRTLGAIFPTVGSSAPCCLNVPVGTLSSGGVFAFDPFELYAVGALQSPNLVVFGQLGKGKSALVKSFLARQSQVGRSYFVIDPKGEYSSLATYDGATIIELGGSTDARVDPFVDLAEGRVSAASAFLAINGFYEALAKREPTAMERAVLREVAGHVRRSEHATSLDAVVDEVSRIEPSRREDKQAREAFYHARAEVVAQLERVRIGELSTLFGPDRFGGDRAKVVVDCSALYGTDALPIVVSVLMQRRINQFRDGRVPNGFVVVDEAWAVLDDPHIANWFRALWKLARSFGCANIAITHRVSDLRTSNSLHRAHGVLSDAETFVVFNQPTVEARETMEFLGLPAELGVLVEHLPVASALWIVGKERFLVRHRLLAHERELVDTDSAMKRGASDAPR